MTLGTLLHGAWALLLGRLTGRDDVVFGSTVSGRDADVYGIESAVGLFINTVPLRLRRASTRVHCGHSLARLHDEQAELLDHLGLAKLQRLTGVDGDLFAGDTLLGGPGRQPGCRRGAAAARPSTRRALTNGEIAAINRVVATGGRDVELDTLLFPTDNGKRRMMTIHSGYCFHDLARH